LLPTAAADAWLPLQNGTWGGVLSQADLREWLNNNADWRTGDRALTKRFQGSQRFIGEMDSLPRNTFHYFHIAIPHRPYGYLPSGRQYKFSMQEDKFNVHDMTVGEISQVRAAHILQVGLADRILGSFKHKLIELGYWDDAMVIVVADHGQAYQPKSNNRIVTPQNLGNIAFVPLLIKYPGQKVGVVDDSNVQTIDIAPTIVNELGIQNAPQVDGRSLLDESADIPEMKILLSGSGENYEFSAKAYDVARTNAHKESVVFFSLHDKRSNLFNYGAGLDYVGEKLDTLSKYRVQAQLSVHTPQKYQAVDVDATYLPIFIQGEIVEYSELDPNDVVVAISINGTVRAVTTPYYSSGGVLQFDKILPEDALEPVNDLVAVLLAADQMQVDAVQQ
jgi:hypothetical protein